MGREEEKEKYLCEKDKYVATISRGLSNYLQDSYN